MHPATLITAATPPRILRRLVLGGALLLALTIALAPRSPGVHAQEARPASPPAAPASPKAPALSKPLVTAWLPGRTRPSNSHFTAAISAHIRMT